jgi:hypothetical protein
MNDMAFEDRLWDALAHEAGRPAADLPADAYRARPARRVVTGGRVGLGLVAAAVTGTALAVLPGGSGAAPAYAVEVAKDGDVTITYEQANAAVAGRGQIEALEAKLRAAGVMVLEDPRGVYECRPTGAPADMFTYMGGGPHEPDPQPSVVTHSVATAIHSDETYVDGWKVVHMRPGETVVVDHSAPSPHNAGYDVNFMAARCTAVP